MTDTTNDPLEIVAGANYIPIKLRGEVVHLVPSFGAARAISSKFGGVAAAVRRVLDFDVDAVAEIVALGLGYTSPTKRPPKDLPEQVFAAGLVDNSEGDLAHRCVVFLKAISNGGRVVASDATNAPSDSDDEAQEAAAPADPQ